jgi:uncharacterized membrane protein
MARLETDDFRSDRRRVLWGGILAGVGLGGFFDGIVLHQILQWHHLVSNRYPPTTLGALQLNTLADGLFHGATWMLTVIGLFLLWSVARRRRGSWPLSLLTGLLLVGWGLFNVGEGIINHHILALHHVRPGPNRLAWDLGFLGWGVAMLVGGGLLVRTKSTSTAVESDAPTP